MPTSSTFGMSSDGLKTRSARAKAKPPPGSAPRHSAPARGTVGTGASRFHGAPASPARRSAELNTTPPPPSSSGARSPYDPAPAPKPRTTPKPAWGANTTPKRRVSLVERQTQYAKGRASSSSGTRPTTHSVAKSPVAKSPARSSAPAASPARSPAMSPAPSPPRSPRSPSSSVTPSDLSMSSPPASPRRSPRTSPRTSMNPTTHTASGGPFAFRLDEAATSPVNSPPMSPRSPVRSPRVSVADKQTASSAAKSVRHTSAAVAASPGKLGALSPVTSPTRERPDTERARAAKAVQERMFAEFDAERRAGGGVEDSIAEFNENRLRLAAETRDGG